MEGGPGTWIELEPTFLLDGHFHRVRNLLSRARTLLVFSPSQDFARLRMVGILEGEIRHVDLQRMYSSGFGVGKREFLVQVRSGPPPFFIFGRGEGEDESLGNERFYFRRESMKSSPLYRYGIDAIIG